MEAIGVLEQLLKIKKAYFGTNSREVIISRFLSSCLVHEDLQIALWDLQYSCCVLFEERGFKFSPWFAEEVRRIVWK